jgi:hypothetical protein
VDFSPGTIPPTITTSSLPDGNKNAAYSATLAAIGGTKPYTWSIATGAVPTGLTLGSSTGVISGTPTGTGTASFTVKLTDAASQTTTQTLSLTVTNNWTIWPNTVVPAIADNGPDSAVELGVKFRTDSDGYINGIRFYKGAGNTGTHVGNLWSSTGTLLGSATFSGETASGWQQVNFASPILIAANTVYVVSYHTNVGHFSVDRGYFATSGVDNPPLHAPADGVSGPNGLYMYGSASAFPANSTASSNYWVDVVFSPK